MRRMVSLRSEPVSPVVSERAASILANNFRYADESRLRRLLNDLRYYQRLKRGSDTLRVAGRSRDRAHPGYSP
jgi:hypothetical protein